MRLLKHNNDGESNLTKDFGGKNAIPPYAILSHTWGLDTEEVTFEDMKNSSGKDKPGYKKLRFCGEQARRDGLQYFWIDTCCINKENKAELSQAIRSMFHWYRDATRCYVYLSDVSSESDFRKSRWFTRGWTLQELLAPYSVEFYSREWNRLGDKSSLQQCIHEITGIPNSALQGAPLAQFKINDLLFWVQHRNTKLPEDRYYSLMGILDISIPPAYGEGAKGAFERLSKEIKRWTRCVKDLRPTDPRDDKKRIEDTKGGLLKDSYRWILDNADFQQWRDDEYSQLLWIKGDPGKGKTMLLCGIIDELKKSKAKADLLSFFFCQATDSRINNATAVLRGLLYMMADQQPSLATYIQGKYDHAGKTLFEDVNAWVALTEILMNVLQDPNLSNMYLIIDALDECLVDLPKLLDFIKQQSISSRVKWIVSSRNWLEIEEQLEWTGNKATLSLELNAESVSTAVSIFIKHKVSQLAQDQKYSQETQDAVLKHLASNADDTFLWVALVCQNLKQVRPRNVMKRLDSFPPGLDDLYTRMMQKISNSDDADICKQILALVTIVYRPITMKELAPLIQQLKGTADDQESIQEIISSCGSFLALREETIYFIHQSAKDFLLTRPSKETSKGAFYEIFPFGASDIHYAIFSASLQIMSGTLHRDMYGLKELGCLTKDVKQPHQDPLAASRYACFYWIDHLYDSDPNCSSKHAASLQDKGTVYEFLRQKYLYWLESLSLCKGMSKGVDSMAKLEMLVQKASNAIDLSELIQDARRFIMYHKGAIERSPLQTYSSALLFSPARSLVRRIFEGEEPKWITIKPALGDLWSACLQTLEGHSNSIRSVAFTYNSTRLASASDDRTVKIWNVRSGECEKTLKGHSGSIQSVAFTHDSTRLLSASSDGIIKIWNIGSGECEKTLGGHSGYVQFAAFTHNSTWVALASSDGTITIWNITSGECEKILKGHNKMVLSVAFTYDSTRLASTSDDRTVKIWNVRSGECEKTLKGHSGSIQSVAFTHDSTRLASSDITIKIWNVSSGECEKTLKGHIGSVRSVAFTYDSTRLASASNDGTVKIWNVSSGECEKTLEGHNGLVQSVAFTHDSIWLASASSDGTVKIWDVRSDEREKTQESHSGYVQSMAFTNNSTRLASASDDGIVKIWNVGSGECEKTLKGHSDLVLFVVFTYDSIRLASASSDETIKIWNVSSGECEKTLEGHSGWVRSVAFTHDSIWLASASSDETVKIWNVRSGKCEKTLKGHIGSVRSVAFTYDSTRLASASSDETIKIWNVSSGECEKTLEGHSGWVQSVAFTHDSIWLASASSDETVKIWNVSSGECEQTLKIGYSLQRISFDITGLYLYTEIGTIAIATSLFPQGANITKPQRRQYQVRGVSLDGAWITYDDKYILLLPSEFQAYYSATSENNIGISVRSGKVWICRLEPES